MAISNIGNRAMQDQVTALLSPTRAMPPNRAMQDGLLSTSSRPGPEPQYLLAAPPGPKPDKAIWTDIAAQIDEWNTVILPMLGLVEGGYQNDITDFANFQGFNGDGSAEPYHGGVKGDLVGTNLGITAMNLAEYEDKDRYDITVEDIKAVTPDVASRIFKHQYYDKYKIGDIKKASFRKLAGVMTPLRNAAERIVKANEKAGKTLKQTVRDVVLEYRNVESDTKHNKYIKGWVNRARQVAEMPTFTTKQQMYNVYPELMYDMDGRRRLHPPPQMPPKKPTPPSR